LNDEKETRKTDEEKSSIIQSPKRILEAGTKRFLQLISIDINIGCDNESNDDEECNDGDESNDNESNDDDDDENEEEYEEKKLVASDGSGNDYFGASCSMSEELVVVGAHEDIYEGAAYLFHLNGTEVKKLTPEDDGDDDDRFGVSVSMDEKVVVGSYYGDYVRLFSRNGTYERTIRCELCTYFGYRVATLGNLIVASGIQNFIGKLFIYTKEGQLLKTLEQEGFINDVAMSEQFIASTAQDGKTIIYSNTSPDFTKIAEINQGGTAIAVSNDRLVMGNQYANDGATYLYKTDGTLVTALNRQDASGGSFGVSVAITDDKVIVSAPYDGGYSGSVFIYSAVTGEFLEKVLAPHGRAWDRFGWSVCASDSYYVVGATGVDYHNTGAAYLFQFSE